MKSRSVGIGATPLSAAIASLGTATVELEGYGIRGEDFEYMVSMPVRKRMPNVTVHGKVKYRMENGDFYLLDDDGKEFKLIVLRKSALPEKF